MLGTMLLEAKCKLVREEENIIIVQATHRHGHA